MTPEIVGPLGDERRQGVHHPPHCLPDVDLRRSRCTSPRTTCPASRKIIDEPRHLPDLPLDDRACAFALLAAPARLHEAQRGEARVERLPQLVCDEGQELVFRRRRRLGQPPRLLLAGER